MPQVGDLTGLLPRAGSGESQTNPAAVPAAGSAVRPPGAAAALGIAAGAVLEAALVEVTAPGEGIVDLQGRLFRALFPGGLEPGARVVLRVVSTGPPLVLQLPDPVEQGFAQRLSPPAGGFGQAVRALLAAASDPELAPELRRLLEQAEILRLPTSPADLAPALARLVRGSGLFHEAQLARGQNTSDLKVLALQLLSGARGSDLGRLAEAVLGHVEAHQARSALEGTLVFPFFLPWGADGIQGEWAIEERFGGGPSGESASGALRIRLEMPRLGAIEVSLRWSPAGNAVNLRVDPRGLPAVCSHLEELRDTLGSGAGVKVLELKAEPLGRAGPARGPGLLEVRA